VNALRDGLVKYGSCGVRREESNQIVELSSGVRSVSSEIQE